MKFVKYFCPSRPRKVFSGMKGRAEGSKARTMDLRNSVRKNSGKFSQ